MSISKFSEDLELAAQLEYDDFKSFALHCKALREKRSERFIEDWLPILMKRYNIQLRENTSYSINTQKYGIIDYYPKANKLLIRKDNKWIKPGLKWIINNLTN